MKYIIILFFVFWATFGNSQKIIWSTLGNMGSSTVYQNGYTIQQCVGQSSTIFGTVELNGVVYAQGFLNNYNILVEEQEILPLDLVAFEIIEQEKATRLNWESVSEVNLYGYELQRTMDNSNFKTIANIPSENNVINQYHFIDNNIIYNQRYYYRLKMIDNDGSFTYSDIVNAIIIDNGSITGYPNPTTGMLTIISNIKGFENLKIIDFQGRNVVDKVSVTYANQEAELNFSGLPNGVYMILTNTMIQRIILIK